MSKYGNILCVTDFSHHSTQACKQALALSQEHGARLTLMHVIDHFPVNRSNDLIAPENQDPKKFHETKALEAMQQQAAELGSTTMEQVVTFSEHAPSHEIVRYAKESGNDLIVIASHEHKGIAAYFRDTAREVEKHAGCEVLLVATT
jgi:universal stress protein A